MIRLNHNWNEMINNQLISELAVCKFCDRIFYTIWVDMKHSIIIFSNEVDERNKQEIDYANSNFPCLTEDEYLIKGIIE